MINKPEILNYIILFFLHVNVNFGYIFYKVCSHRNTTGRRDSLGYYVQQTGSCIEVSGTQVDQITKPSNKATAGISARYSPVSKPFHIHIVELL